MQVILTYGMSDTTFLFLKEASRKREFQVSDVQRALSAQTQCIRAKQQTRSKLLGPCCVVILLWQSDNSGRRRSGWVGEWL